MDNESIGASKAGQRPAPSRRSRAAEVHNLSERVSCIYIVIVEFCLAQLSHVANYDEVLFISNSSCCREEEIGLMRK